MNLQNILGWKKPKTDGRRDSRDTRILKWPEMTSDFLANVKNHQIFHFSAQIHRIARKSYNMQYKMDF